MKCTAKERFELPLALLFKPQQNSKMKMAKVGVSY